MEPKKIVIKIGTSSLTHSNGNLNIEKIDKFIEVISELKNQDKQVILVSSGAVGIGIKKLKITSKPIRTRQKQAAAAVGQSVLMHIYSKLFAEFGYTVAQILLTKDIMDIKERKENALNTFNTLLDLGVIPIVNENDSVSVEEIEFGDNDTLSARVAKLIKADLLIILTDIDGLYDRNPAEDGAKLITYVNEITEDIKKVAGNPVSKVGTGGMTTKVMAAEIATSAGIDTIVANSSSPKIIYDILNNDYIGTLFLKKQT